MVVTEEIFLDTVQEQLHTKDITVDILLSALGSINPDLRYKLGRWIISRFPIFSDSISEKLDGFATNDAKSNDLSIKQQALIWKQCRMYSEEKGLRMQLIMLYDDVLFIQDPMAWYFNRRGDDLTLATLDQQTGAVKFDKTQDLDKIFDKLPMGLGVSLDSNIITGEKAFKVAKHYRLLEGSR